MAIFKTYLHILSFMKILKIVLMLAGAALIVYGIYNVFVPQEVVVPLEANAGERLSNQAMGMIGIGVFALLAGALIKNRR